jgi:CheY-like chemotaxis protein
MRESVVKPLPFLRSIVGGCPAGQSRFLLALQEIATARDACGLGRLPKSFLWRKDLDCAQKLLLTDCSRTELYMPSVLIVDNDNAFRKQLRTLFDEGRGFDACLEAGNGVEALDKTKRLLPNLAVLDFSLPDMSGIQLAQELKAITSELPIFLLTADYDTDIERAALSCGITAVFSKLDDLAPLVANARAVCGIE